MNLPVITERDDRLNKASREFASVCEEMRSRYRFTDAEWVYIMAERLADYARDVSCESPVKG